jgi:hypothetical protein
MTAKAATRAKTAPPDKTGRPGLGIDSLWPVVERIIAPTTLLVALTFYFGRQLTSARSAWFGIDASLLGFSTQDYVVRSADALFIPLGVLALVTLASVEIYELACRAADRSPPSRHFKWAVPLVAGAGALLLAVGLYAAKEGLPTSVHYLVGPVCPAVGILLIALAARIHRRLAPRPSGDGPPAPDATRKVLVVAIVVLSLFWTTSQYALALGRGRAATLEAHLERLPAAVVFSRTRLELSGAQEQTMGPGGHYRYRYDGLRFFIRSGGLYVFLPDDWSRDEGAAIVLGDSPDVRFEFLAPRRGGAS